MDAADALSRLHDVREPATGSAETIADALAGGSLGLLSALLAFVLVRSFTQRSLTRREIARAELRRARGLAPDQRLLAQAKVLDRVAPDASGRSGEDELSETAHSSDDPDLPWRRLRGELHQALYRPNPTIDLDRIEGEILQLLASRRC